MNLIRNCVILRRREDHPMRGYVAQSLPAFVLLAAQAMQASDVKPLPTSLRRNTIQDLCAAQAGDVWIHPKTGKRMVVLPTRYIGGRPDLKQDSGISTTYSLDGKYLGTFMAFGSARRFITGFLMDATEVTNAEYLRYSRSAKAPFPAAWKGREPEKLHLDWPVLVSLDEARAYASWAGLSLPMFYEYCAAATDSKGVYPWRTEKKTTASSESPVACNSDCIGSA